MRETINSHKVKTSSSVNSLACSVSCQSGRYTTTRAKQDCSQNAAIAKQFSSAQ